MLRFRAAPPPVMREADSAVGRRAGAGQDGTGQAGTGQASSSSSSTSAM